MPLTPKSPIEEITFELCTEEKLKVGMFVILKAFTVPEAASVTFQSSDNSIIRILPDESNDFTKYGSCILQIVDVGKVKIGCKSDSLREIFELETFESDYQEPQEEAKMIELNTDYVRLCVGEVFQIQAVTNPKNQVVSWRSENYQIANVEDGGIITGCSKGITKVIASYKNYNAECIVEVVELGILGDYFRIGIGEKFRIPVGIYPSTYKILWTSTDDNIAPVNWLGIVEGKQVGTVQITAIVETTTGPISKVITIEVCEWFEPWEYFDKSRMKDLKIFDKHYEIIKYAAGREIRVVDKAGMPKLYYIRTDNHPYLYNYEVAAVDDDIQKFLLMQ